MIPPLRYRLDASWRLGIVLALRGEAADRLRIYVSNEDSGEITVIDPASGQVLQRISVGKRPRGIKLAPNGKLLYVALSGSPARAREWMSPSSRPRTARPMASGLSTWRRSSSCACFPAAKILRPSICRLMARRSLSRMKRRRK